MEYLILRVNRNGRTLRALVTGFSKGDDYTGEDTYVSPGTEAAVTLCALGNTVSLHDYALFLQSCVNGTFETDLPNSYRFPYRELMGTLSNQMAAYFDGDAEFFPNGNEITRMIASSNHRLGVFEASNLSGSQVQRAIITPDGNAQLIISYNPEDSSLSSSPIEVFGSSHEDGSFRWNAYRLNLGNNILRSASIRIIEKNPLGTAPVLKISDSAAAPQIAAADAVLSEVSGHRRNSHQQCQHTD